MSRASNHLNCLAVIIKATDFASSFLEHYLGAFAADRADLLNERHGKPRCGLTNVEQEATISPYSRDHSARPSGFHHVTYRRQPREIFRRRDISWRTASNRTGPTTHRSSRRFFRYVYEPGGNRVEVAQCRGPAYPVAYWKPIVWTE